MVRSLGSNEGQQEPVGSIAQTHKLLTRTMRDRQEPAWSAAPLEGESPLQAQATNLIANWSIA